MAVPSRFGKRRRFRAETGKRIFAGAPYLRRLAVQALEDRRVLSIDFVELARSVAGPGGAISNIKSTLRGINSLTRLPLINKPIQQISQLTDSLDKFQAKLQNEVNALNSNSIASAVQDAVYAALGPSGADVLQNRKGPASVDPEDVCVDLGSDHIDIRVNIGFTTANFNSSVGLGIDSVPLQPKANELGGDFDVTVTYNDFNFGYNPAPSLGGFYFQKSVPGRIELKLEGSLPTAPITVGLGFFDMQMTDKHPGKDVTLTLSADVDASGISSPRITGDLNFYTHLSVQLNKPGLPHVETDFLLQWQFDSVAPSTPLGSGWGAPTLAFQHVQLGLGSLLGGIAKPIAAQVKEVIEPLEPLFDVLEKRIPGISDVSEEVGVGQINLLTLTNALSGLPQPPTELINMVRSAERLRSYAQNVERLAGLAGDALLDLGDFTITAPSGGNLLSAVAPSPLGSAIVEQIQNEYGEIVNELKDWSNLVNASGDLNVDFLRQKIRAALSETGIADEVDDLFDGLSGTSQQGGLTVTYPIVTDPAGVILGMLLGQDRDLVTVTGSINYLLDRGFDIKIIPGFSIHVAASGGVDALAKLGYDTRGLREAMEPLYAGGSFDAGKLMNGFWIDRHTHAYVNGQLGLGPLVGIRGLEFILLGSVDANLHADLSNPQSRDKIRPFIPGDLADWLFDVSGRFTANLTFTIRAGADVPGLGFVGFNKTWNLASVTLYEFTAPHLAKPATLNPPPPEPAAQLYTFDSQTGILYLNAGPRAGDRNFENAVVNETFVVRRVRPTRQELESVNFLEEITGKRYYVFDISFSGVTQRVRAPVTKVSADMGSGKDYLKVIDDSSPIIYSLYGGDEDDTIDVDGRVDVYISGGEGRDTLDGGGGRSNSLSVEIDGGEGSDKISFADGNYTLMNPDGTFIVSRSPGDTSRDRIKIDNSRSHRNVTYLFTDDFFGYDKFLTISEQGTGAITNVYTSRFDDLDLYSGTGNDTFLGMPTDMSRMYAGDGDDTWDLNFHSDGKLPIRSFTQIVDFPHVYFFGAGGTNEVRADDSRHSLFRNYLLQADDTSGGECIMTWSEDSATAFAVTLGGVRRTTFTTADLFDTVEVRGWSEGSLTVRASKLRLAADVYSLWDTDIGVPGALTLNVFDLHPASDFSSAVFDSTAVDVNLPEGYRIRVYTQFSGVIYYEFNVDDAQVNFDEEFLSRQLDISFNRDGGSVKFVLLEPRNLENFPDYNYVLESDGVTINGKRFFFTGITSVSLIGGRGIDHFLVRSFLPGTVALFDGRGAPFGGGPGNDMLVFDDSQTLADASYVVTPTTLDVFNRFAAFLQSIENIQILCGQGNDELLVVGDFTQPLLIDAGRGNDQIEVGDFSDSFTTFRAPVRIDAGEGDDTLRWMQAINGYYENQVAVVNRVALNGGTGDNKLQIDENRYIINRNEFSIFPDRFRTSSFGFDLWTDFVYDDFTSGELDLSAAADLVQVYGISSDVVAGKYFTIRGNEGGDTVNIYPVDNEDNPTINGSLAVQGGVDGDRVLLDSSYATSSAKYTVNGVFGATIVSGLGVSLGNTVSSFEVEQFDIRTGDAADTVRIESFQAAATAMAISTGGGDDRLQIALEGGDLFQAISAAASFSFDGGSGDDAFSLDNSASTESDYYTRDDDYLRVTRPGRVESYTFSPVNFESMDVTAGSGGDQFFVEFLPAGQSLALHAADGGDSFRIARISGNTQQIRGWVLVDGGVDGGSLYLSSNGSASARVHIEPTSVGLIGAAPGDTLFGPGGWLQFVNLADDVFGVGISLSLGSGPDTIFAAPQTTATLRIDASAPTTSPGDQLHLALAGVLNPVLEEFDADSGSLSSDNFKPLVWTGIEGQANDYVVPPSLIVSNVLDSGPGSLRQALIDADAKPNANGPDLIRFLIPGTGGHTIRPLSPYPGIYDPVVIDGTTQPGYAGRPVIELDGSGAGPAYGLVIYSGGSTVRGLAINRFVAGANAAILLSGDGNVIQGNFIGTNLAGDAVFPVDSQSQYGIAVYGTDGNLIGTDGDGSQDASEGNLISGNNTAGILLVTVGGLQPDNNVIAGNRIGTNLMGDAALANGRMGIFFIGAGERNRIGTDSNGVGDVAERNLISGNREAGIFIDSNNNVVAGNIVGATSTGDAPLPNGDGVIIASSASGNRIGGTSAGAGNVISYNTYSGVLVRDSGTGNAILGNSIFSNARLGINLNAAGDPGSGVTLNDYSDADTGPNQAQNFPLLATARTIGQQTVVGGTLQSTPRTTFRVELFSSVQADPSGYGEGRTFLGWLNTTTDASGAASFTSNLTVTVPVGQFVTAAATDPAGNTSEFSASIPVTADGGPANVALLRNPTNSGFFTLSSPTNSRITATISSTAGVAPPAGIAFPFGYLNFTVQGVAPGGAATVSIAGLDVSQIGDYFKYGRTPANRGQHWYNFLLGQATDRDSAVGTGMEIVGSTIVLHFIDGQRGDDDLAANGVIADIGGPVLNHAPLAAADTVTTKEDADVTIAAALLKKNDKDADGDTLTITGVKNAASGVASLVNGAVVFTPAPDFYGAAGFDYVLSDGYLTATGHVTVNVTPVNDAPVASGDTAVVAEDGSVDINVRGNDRPGPANESSQTLSIKSAKALHGTVQIVNNLVRYKPAANYFGPDTITYVIVDNGTTNGRSNPLSATGTVSVTVESVNDAPVAKDLTTQATEDAAVQFALAGADLETPTGALLFTITSLPTQGMLTTPGGTEVHVGDRFTGPPTLRYKSGASREGTGQDSFTFLVTDEGGSPIARIDDGLVRINITKAVADGKATIDSSGVVRVGGTSGNDTILVLTSGSKMQVIINQRVVCSNVPLTSVKELHVWGRSGNDKVRVLLDVPALIHGGDGDDDLEGGLGENMIFGGRGNDRLTGGVHADLLLGGEGSDSLTDALGNNILFGGAASSVLSDDIYRQVLRQWNQRPPSAQFLNALTDDRAVDSLFDGWGDDWHILDPDDLRADLAPFDSDRITFR